MTESITRIYPSPVREMPLEGAYLAHELRAYAGRSDKPYVYSNFIASIDGRIAIPRKDGGGLVVPKMTANERDWRLFQEVAAQADIIISSGRYLREWAEGRAQEILQVDDPRFADLRDWRQSHDLRPQPDIAIISGSLRFPIPEVLTAGGRKFVVFTIEGHAPERIEEIRAKGGEVFVTGKDSVSGALMVDKMSELGYQTVYSSAGPKINHLLLAGGALDRLYLTYANRLLGGSTYASILEGELLNPPTDLKINSIYYDPAGVDGLGQLFVVYDRVRQPG